MDTGGIIPEHRYFPFIWHHPALSASWRELTVTLLKAAKKAGCKISFDVNYRGKLWTPEEAGKSIRAILPYVDYCSAGSLDAQHFLGPPYILVSQIKKKQFITIKKCRKSIRIFLFLFYKTDSSFRQCE